MIRGTSHDQDARFKDKAQKMLLQSNWPDKYDIKIDLTKIDFEALRLWVQKRTTQLLGEQDDIVSGTLISILEQSLNKQQKPNAKKIHVAMSGFMTNNTLIFISQLWDWLDQAQKSRSGISKKLLDGIKQEDNQRKKRHKVINQRKDKIKNYKFDIIKGLIGRQRQPSVEVKRRQRRQQLKRSQQKTNKKQKKNRRRSQDRQKKKKKRHDQSQSQSQQNNQNRKKKHSSKRKDRRKHRRSYSRSLSPQDQQQNSRSRQKQKNNRKQSPPSDRSMQKRKKKLKTKNKKYQSQGGSQQSKDKKQKGRSNSKSQSSQVISSSSQN